MNSSRKHEGTKKRKIKLLLTTAVLLIAQTICLSAPGANEFRDFLVHHDLKVKMYPEEYRFTAEDRITLPEDHPSELHFLLHKGLAPVSDTPRIRVIRENGKPVTYTLESFKVTIPPGRRSFVLRYGGRLHHPLEGYGKEYARGFKRTLGIISEEGVYLSGDSYWYPNFLEGLMTFNLHVIVPSDWDMVSQGERKIHVINKGMRHVRWESTEPQEEIYLIAGRFSEFSKPAGRVKAMVFLRTPDEELANRYLDVTGRYLAMYEKLIGPFPYKKFALVENFWETGYGMPSFTLMGSKVIRFPFILHSSYPHEILHNWWGNSVFPEYKKGNWTEGLTAYLADHLIKEQQVRGASYRQTVLQKYTDYVTRERDFPLTEFEARHSAPTEAVGYGKSLMFFHMLRLRLSDQLFVEGLRKFYRENRFSFASFEDLLKSFEEVSGRDLKFEFDQWVKRPGAPKLKITNAGARSEGSGYVLTALLEQVQPGETYKLMIPVAVTMEGRTRTRQVLVAMEERRLQLKLILPDRPLRIDVDPEFDLFRKLDRGEIPPALTQAFGSKKVLILLPSSPKNQGMLQSYRDLARSWSQSGPDEVEVMLDSEVRTLPSDRAVVLLGWENRFLDAVAFALTEYDVKIDSNSVKIGTSEISRENHSIVLTVRNPKNRDLALTWVATDLPQAIAGLGRKLPHYHKYSYLGFKGEEPANTLKGRWPVLNSPMTQFVPREDGTVIRVEMGELATREPLANLPPIFSKERMIGVIRFLSSDEMAGEKTLILSAF